MRNRAPGQGKRARWWRPAGRLGGDADSPGASPGSDEASRAADPAPPGGGRFKRVSALFRGWVRYGVVPGVAVLVVSWLALLVVNGGFSVMGQSNEKLTTMVLDRYLWTLVGALAASLAVAVVVGAGLGLMAAGLIASVRGTRPARGSGWATAGIVLAYHLGAWMLHMRALPQMHAETFYNRGGVWAALQRGVTHGLPDWIFTALLVIGVGLPVLALLRAATRSWLRVRWSAYIGLTLLVLYGGYRLVVSGDSGGTAARPNILILANDSMRPDHLGTYGYARPTSPNLDRFAASAVVFEQAYVPLARTYPSWASILTGELPFEHGIRHMFPRKVERLDERLTLPRYLAEQGYRTAAVGDSAGDIFARMGAGFERVSAPDFNLPSLIRQRVIEIQPALLPYLNNRVGRALFPDAVGLVNYPHTAETVDRLMDEIDAGDGRPFFIVGFFSSSHFPYAAADPWYRRFVQPGYEGPNLYQRLRTVDESGAQVAADAPQMVDLFDGTISYFDAELGRLLDRLRDAGRLDDTLVIITADHGECLGEFGTTGHGDHLRGRVANRVPLIVHDPAQGARRVPGLVRTIDLARTLAIRATGQAPAAFGGADLNPMLTGEASDLGLLGYGETGVWMGADGEEFFQHHRLAYPGLTGVVELEPGTNGEISMQPGYEDRVRVAKHRAVWDRTHKVIAMPTATGVVLEGWRVEGDTEVPEPPRADLVEALNAYLTEGGRAQVVEGFSLPKAPIAAP